MTPFPIFYYAQPFIPHTVHSKYEVRIWTDTPSGALCSWSRDLLESLRHEKGKRTYGVCVDTLV